MILSFSIYPKMYRNYRMTDKPIIYFDTISVIIISISMIRWLNALSINPSNAKANFVQSTNTQRFSKNI